MNSRLSWTLSQNKRYKDIWGTMSVVVCLPNMGTGLGQDQHCAGYKELFVALSGFLEESGQFGRS